MYGLIIAVLLAGWSHAAAPGNGFAVQPPKRLFPLQDSDVSKHRQLESTRRKLLLSGDRCSSSMPTTHTLSSGEFGIGSGISGSGYAHTQLCKYIVKDASAGLIGVAFTFFHTEANQDTVKIYDNERDPQATGTPLATYSGDLSAPILFAKSGVNQLLIVFTSDDQLHSDSRTQQLGFNARAWDAQSSCFDASCNGHGTCQTRDGYKQCSCSPTISDSAADSATWYLGATCGTAVPHLGAVNGQDAFSPSSGKAVGPVAVGKWSYFWVDLRLLRSGYRFLLDFKDTGGATSDPLLVLGMPFSRSQSSASNQPVLPSLNDQSTYYEDYFSWFYDRSNIHYIHFDRHTRGFGATNTDLASLVAVYNHAARAQVSAEGQINLRKNSPHLRMWPCVRSCSGHGTCQRPGRCRCNSGWYGNGWSSPDTCAYEVIDITQHLDQKISTNAGSNVALQVSPIRIGTWAYFKLDIVDPTWIDDRTIAIDFTSLSPHAQPIVVVRKNRVPHLKYGFLPTFDAFDFDFGDKNGFEVLQGQRQNIVIRPEELELGTYYIGVYDIWGHTALPQESHDDVNFTMYVSKYQAGVPCPKGPENQWCSGLTRNLSSPQGETTGQGTEANACDFNLGVCLCPENALGLDCSMAAERLVPGESNYITKSSPGLEVKGSNYFFVTVTELEAGIIGDKSTGKNLVVDLVKLNSNEKSFPVLLARKGAAPYGTDRSLFDDHDYVARYHESEEHRILLDKEELTQGTWYFSVVNEEDPDGEEEPLTYKIRARFLDHVQCLSDDEGTPCSGHGTCDTLLGRCYCDSDYTGDDCGDNGPYELVLSSDGHSGSGSPAASVEASSANGQTPPIPVDEWSYYAVAIGCNTSIRVTFTTTDSNTRPLLVLEKDRLPLMVDSTHEYDDYYNGLNTFGKKQVIEVHPCVGETNIQSHLRCFIHPLFPGTSWKTGSPKPGVWYIGIYNDPNVGSGGTTDPIVNYNLKVEQLSSCDTANNVCAEGFRDASKQCQTACPGLHPEEGRHVFTNTPMPDPVSCSGHGTCSLDGSTCTCDAGSGWSGRACGDTCPGRDPTCSGHGVCVEGASSTNNSKPLCKCEPSFAGPQCELKCAGENGCSGHGECDLNDLGTATVCKCRQGYAGLSCELECPKNKNGVSCGGQGKCTTTKVSDSNSVEAVCVCEDNYIGVACDHKCPLGVFNFSELEDAEPQVCSGKGTCVEREGLAACACFDKYGGNICNETTISTLEVKKLSKKVMSPTAVGVAVGVSIASAVIIGLGFIAYRRNQAQLKRYEVTFGTDALLAAEGEQRSKTSKKKAASLAAEDVLAQGAFSIQLQGLGEENSDQ